MSFKAQMKQTILVTSRINSLLVLGLFRDSSGNKDNKVRSEGFSELFAQAEHIYFASHSEDAGVEWRTRRRLITYCRRFDFRPEVEFTPITPSEFDKSCQSNLYRRPSTETVFSSER